MKPKRWELIVLGLLVLGLALWALWPGNPGNAVSVTRNGEEIGRYALNRDLEEQIRGHGGFSLTLVIEDGQARVEESTCPDLICQHHAPISDAGEQIVCLPARVVITVLGEEGSVDAVVR